MRRTLDEPLVMLLPSLPAEGMMREKVGIGILLWRYETCSCWFSRCPAVSVKDRPSFSATASMVSSEMLCSARSKPAAYLGVISSLSASCSWVMCSSRRYQRSAAPNW